MIHLEVVTICKRLFRGLRVACKHSIVYETLKLIAGWREYSRLRRRFGRDALFIICSGATGDIYLQLSMIPQYLSDHSIEGYLLISDNVQMPQIAGLFDETNYYLIEYRKRARIEKYIHFMNVPEEKVLIPFFWYYSSSFNRCRVRMTEHFSFMDTYQLMSFPLLNDTVRTLKKPHFIIADEDFVQRYKCKGVVPEKTVIISPHAKSVTSLPAKLWNHIIHDIYDLGYQVIVNSELSIEHDGIDAPHLYPEYAESVPLLEMAGIFLGVRSGFCEIISSAKCKKIILYPESGSGINYSEHRSDVEFSGLFKMGLSDGMDLVEISTTLLHNITDSDVNVRDQAEDDQKANELRAKIIDSINPV